MSAETPFVEILGIIKRQQAENRIVFETILDLRVSLLGIGNH